ncbi:hypothetical protein HDU87_002067 [Geranomyces variabilis]|uniref:Uncharacterized protein n=1 Tax=Geranomyces variabilis TaxID=109894 RepID=A0AAD5TCC2_9FUNG|nr:hypothetical protein HDU87_002067 [Geranomyces variabilis]
MPAPPLPADLDVNISAFMMFCERLSNIEERLDAWDRNARHTQMSRNGFLDHKLLGHRFLIERRPSDDRRLDVEQQANADHYPDCMMVTIEYRCVEHKQGLCDGNAADLSYFTPAETEKIRHADLAYHPSPKSVGIPSALACLCEEALRRQVLSSCNRKAFSECYLLPRMDEGECTIFLRAVGRQDVNAFVNEAATLFSLRHNRSCILSMVVEDSDIFFMRVHELGMRWLAGNDEERRHVAATAREFKLINDLSLKDMRKHCRFSLYVQHSMILKATKFVPASTPTEPHTSAFTFHKMIGWPPQQLENERSDPHKEKEG